MEWMAYIMNESTHFNEFGDDFDYFDDHQDEDPFMPKKSCTRCGGDGEVLGRDDIGLECMRCHGTGVEPS